MALPEYTQEVVSKILTQYCEDRIPVHVRDKVRLGFSFRGQKVTLFEERPSFRNPKEWSEFVVAQFRMDKETLEWSLYWPNQNSKWLPHEEFVATRDFEVALAEVEANPNGMFWG